MCACVFARGISAFFTYLADSARLLLFSSECINLNAFDKKTTPLMLSLLRVPFRGYPDGGLSRLSIFDKEYRLLGGQGKLSGSPQMLNIYNLALTN